MLPPVDILLSHNSPKGVHNRDNEIHIGFDALNEFIKFKKPSLLIHGHQHKNIQLQVDDTMGIGVYGHKIFEI